MRPERTFEDKRESFDKPTYVIKYFLSSHRDDLLNDENKRRKNLKQSSDISLDVTCPKCVYK